MAEDKFDVDPYHADFDLLKIKILAVLETLSVISIHQKLCLSYFML